eukprot:TRINITY_DN5038_c0_g3_i4.p1 TRINITY_DN5038_c0_g3~~TRINITY_DN5038_c0_g3_i4.p1  ORF type:complete len:560 (-),score=86.50 TRINITY_DN5038_c0_g3_i4:39-1718(-)
MALFVPLAILATLGHGKFAQPWQWNLGQVDWNITTTSSESQEAFLLGAKLLHNFAYEVAREEFIRAQSSDPQCVMCVWGEAMTYKQGLWSTENLESGRQTMNRLEALDYSRVTELEKAYANSISVLFDASLNGGAGRRQRERNFENAMREIYESVPEDPNAAALYVVSMLTIADLYTRNFTMRGGQQLETAFALLGRFILTHPTHPGVLHMSVHAWDYPEVAFEAEAETAAAQYALISSSHSHPVHMPAHIYLRRGDWARVTMHNTLSAAVSKRFAFWRGWSIEREDVHAAEFQQYADLQCGRVSVAQEHVNLYQMLAEWYDPPKTMTVIIFLRSLCRQTLETNDWDNVVLTMPDEVSCATCQDETNTDGMFKESNHANCMAVWRVGMAAARRGVDPEEYLAKLEEYRVQTQQELAFRSLEIGLMILQIESAYALSQGDSATATALLVQASSEELTIDPPGYGEPMPPKPSHELLGELHLHLGNYEEALQAFELAQRASPNRGLTLLGFARTYAAFGDRSAASEYYTKFLQQWSAADENRPELAEARDYLAAPRELSAL